MNPFSGELGDYSVIMATVAATTASSSGRASTTPFGMTLPHMGPWTFSALFSPGQNRSFDDGNISSGESSCAGGNAPGSGRAPAAVQRRSLRVRL